MNDLNQKYITGEQKMCNHDYSNIENTLIGVPKLKMVTPTKYCLQCKQCGEVFTIDRNDIDDIQDFMSTFF